MRLRTIRPSSQYTRPLVLTLSFSGESPRSAILDLLHNISRHQLVAFASGSWREGYHHFTAQNVVDLPPRTVPTLGKV